MEAEQSQGTRGKKSVRGNQDSNNLNQLLEVYLQKTVNNGETYNFSDNDVKLKITGEGQLQDLAQNQFKFSLENLKQNMKEHHGKILTLKKWSFDHQFIENTNNLYVNLTGTFEDRKLIVYVYQEGKDQPSEQRKQLFLNLKKKIIRDKFAQTAQSTSKIYQIIQVFNKHIQEVQKKTPGGKTPGAKTPGAKTPGSKTPGSKTPGSKTPLKKQSPLKKDQIDQKPNQSRIEEQLSLKIKRIMKVCTKTQLFTYAMEKKKQLPLNLQKEKRCDSLRKQFMPSEEASRKKKCYDKDVVQLVMNLYK